MSEFGGPDILGPSEGGGAAPEALSEEAKQRFAAAAAGMQQIRKEEKKSKKRDSRVAKTIIQFLNDDRYTHLFVLISRLVARCEARPEPDPQVTGRRMIIADARVVGRGEDALDDRLTVAFQAHERSTDPAGQALELRGRNHTGGFPSLHVEPDVRGSERPDRVTRSAFVARCREWSGFSWICRS